MKYDLIIIGAGPGGLSSAIYAGRYKLKTLVIGKEIGGLAASAHKICNFPSYIEINGMELMQRIIKQVRELDVEILNDEVLKIEKKSNEFLVSAKKESFKSKKIIFAGGTVRSKLEVNNEEKFLGKGVSYCATCDAGFFKNKKVAVVGGSDAALTSALLLSEYASKIYIIYRGKKYSAEPFWIEKVKENKKIECLCNEEIEDIYGKEFVEGVKLKSGKNLMIEGVFVEIGSVPHTYVLSSLDIKKDAKGYIIVDKNQKTSLEGFYAVGDITNNILKQIVVACGEGAIAAFGVYKEIKREK